MANASSMSSTSVTNVGNTTFTSPPLNQLLNQITTIKLDRGNYLLWKNLAMPILRSYKLEGHLLGTKSCPPEFIRQDGEPVEVTSGAAIGAPSSQTDGSGASTSEARLLMNPQYEAWVTVDQLLLGWLYNSMTPEVATQVMGIENAKGLWSAIQELFGVQSRAEEDFLRQTFQQTRKGNSKMSDYLRLMKTHADNLGLAGSPVSNRNLVSQVLLGLDEEYNAIVAMIQGRASVTWAELQAELLVFEKRLELQNSVKNTTTFSQNASANMASSKGVSSPKQTNQITSNGNGNRPWYNNYNQRGSGNRGRGRGRGYNNYNNRQICQVCGKVGHSALVCYNRFNKEFSPIQNRGNGNGNGNHNQNRGQNQQSNAFMATQPTATPETLADPNWYADSGASNHVTSNYDNLSNPTDYEGQDYGSCGAERSS